MSWKSLAKLGNVSSASVLMCLRDTMYESREDGEGYRPKRGTFGLMSGMGPGFAIELLLVEW